MSKRPSGTSMEERTLDARLLSGDPGVWFGLLLRMLEEQVETCRAIEALSVKQRAAVASGDCDTMLRMLGERQVLVERAVKFHERLGAFREQQGVLLGRMSEVQRRAVEERLEALGSITGRICERDAADRQELEAQRRVTLEHLETLSRGRGAVSAYVSGGTTQVASTEDRQG